MKRAVLAVVLVALVLPATALAHASLRAEQPQFGQRLRFSPPRVALRFDQVVSVLPNAIVILDARGRNHAGAVHVKDHRTLYANVSQLPRGPYTVRWRAMSLDGHVVSGVFTFGVRVHAPNVVDASVGSQGPTRAEDVVRWLMFVAIALLVGGLGFRLLVARRPLPTRFYLITGAGAVGVLEIATLAFLLRCEDALQLPLADFFYGDLSPIAYGTRVGQAFVAMELGFALVAAFLFLAWLTDREVLLWPAFLLGLGFASGLSLSGHSASSTAASFADWVHLAAAALWIGGLVQLVAVVWPLAPELRRPALVRFSRLATVCVALLVGAGIYLSILRLPHLSDLWQSGYGHVLLVKLALVAVALAWGGAHQLIVRGDRSGPHLVRSLAAESAVAIAVLLAAAVLVDSKPPPQQPTRTPVSAVRR